MPVQPTPTRESIAVSGITRPLGNVGVKIFILIEFDRNTIEPFQVKFCHPAINHKPVIGIG
jgi:hypothetical protein